MLERAERHSDQLELRSQVEVSDVSLQGVSTGLDIVQLLGQLTSANVQHIFEKVNSRCTQPCHGGGN